MAPDAPPPPARPPRCQAKPIGQEPHLAQALHDVLVRQVVAARLRAAVLADLPAEPRRDRHALQGLAEGPGLPRELLGHGAAVPPRVATTWATPSSGTPLGASMSSARRDASPYPAPRRRLRGHHSNPPHQRFVITIIIIVVLAHVLPLDLDTRRRDDLSSVRKSSQDGRRLDSHSAALPRQQILGRGPYGRGRATFRPRRAFSKSAGPASASRPFAQSGVYSFAFLDQNIRADPS